jgi:hypothetical protein
MGIYAIEVEAQSLHVKGHQQTCKATKRSLASLSTTSMYRELWYHTVE